MQRTLLKASSPVVVTVLSPSPTVSQSFKDWLISNASNRSPDESNNHAIKSNEDDLDRWGAAAWNSLSIDVSCNNESPPTLLHLLSPAGSSMTKGSLSLLSIQHASSIEESRSQLAAAFAEKGSPFYVRIRRLFNRPILPSHLLDQTLFQWNESCTESILSSLSKRIPVSEATGRPQLKEIALPVDNISLQLPSSGVTGVYQCSSQLAIRPLPRAMHDRFLTVPTLVFHQSSDLKPGPEWHPIGVSSSRKGQLMQYKQGLDVRLCQSTTRESMFCEAQESMLAGSLQELQSTRVLGSKQEDDPNTNKMDCWVEVRANLKRPSGYFTQSKTTPRFAKAPDIPYE